MIFCPRCGAQSNEDTQLCGACDLPLAGVSAIVGGGWKRDYWRRVIITLSLFFAVPFIVLKVGERVNEDSYEFIAGFLLVLLLPGLPWAVSAIFNRINE